jgi:hypothetical protein
VAGQKLGQKVLDSHATTIEATEDCGSNCVEEEEEMEEDQQQQSKDFREETLVSCCKMATTMSGHKRSIPEY